MYYSFGCIIANLDNNRNEKGGIITNFVYEFHANTQTITKNCYSNGTNS